MKLRNQSILLISPEPWHHIFVSKHHYAVHLGRKGNKVYFLNPPGNEKNVQITTYENVWEVNYLGLLPGVRFFPEFIQRRLFRQKINDLQKQCQTTFDIIWSFDNSVMYNLSLVSKKTYIISHIVDWTQDFQFRQACETANLCLGSSFYITEKQKKYNKNTYFVHHGFPKTTNHSYVHFEGNNTVKATYSGNLSIPYIDWKLLNRLIEDNPNVDFHFAGPGQDGAQFEKIIEKKNVYYHGVLTSDELAGFHQASDILLVIYKSNDHLKQLANPHKMMTYLGTGKTIVATWCEEYKHQYEQKLLSMNKDNETFLASFREVVQHLNDWNGEKRTSSRRDFALSHTYDAQIEKVEKYISGDKNVAS